MDELFELLECHSKLNDQLHVVDNWFDRNSNVHTLALDFQMWQNWKSFIEGILKDFPETRNAEVCHWCIQKLRTNQTAFLTKFDDEGDELLISKRELINEGFYRRIVYFQKLVGAASKIESSVFLLSKKLSRIDLIRLLNAMYEADFFTNNKGQKMTKIEWMKTFGNIFGIDLSGYHADLSQAQKTLNIEANIKIFKHLEELTKNQMLSGESIA